MPRRRVALVLCLTLAILSVSALPVSPGACEVDIVTFRDRSTCLQCLLIVCCFTLPDGEITCDSDADCWSCEFTP